MLSRLSALGGWSFVGAAALFFLVVAAMVHGLMQLFETRTGIRPLDETESPAASAEQS